MDRDGPGTRISPEAARLGCRAVMLVVLSAFAMACGDGSVPGDSSAGDGTAGGAGTGLSAIESVQAATGDASELAARVTARLDGLPARTSLFARHLPSGREIAIRADEPMNALSVIKIPVMVLAYRDAEAGRLDLDERYRIRPEDLRRGSGLLQTFAPELEPTYRDLVTQMIITSDNTATDIMIARLGQERVNEMLSQFGYEQTRLRATTGDLFRRVWVMADPANEALSPREVFERGFPSDPEASARTFRFEGDPEEWLGSITAREIAGLLAQIHNAEVASRASSDEMIRRPRTPVLQHTPAPLHPFPRLRGAQDRRLAALCGQRCRDPVLRRRAHGGRRLHQPEHGRLHRAGVDAGPHRGGHRQQLALAGP